MMSLKKRLSLITIAAGMLLSALLYISHNISDFPFLLRAADVLFSDNYTSVMVFSFVAVSIPAFIVYFFIAKYINRRILRISEEMKRVRGLKDLSMRLEEDHHGDEISTLISAVNETLDKLENERISREKAEEMLKTSEKLVSIGRLSASIAHEINNPILAISNCVQALKNTCVGASAVHKDAIALSEKEIERVRQIISNLLDFHRLDKEEFSEVNLNDVLQQSINVLKWGKKLESINIFTENKRNIIVNGSHTKLKQVFVNFMLNAVEATAGKKGVLRVEMVTPSQGGSGGRERQNGRFCEVRFIDNGPGISPKIKDRLFEPFVSTKQGKGVGLGLYISYEIIKNHKGEILYNAAYKGGAYFTIRLPVKERRT
jgi:signal transduction histidine kinase